MHKAIKKPVKIDYMTFDELISFFDIAKKKVLNVNFKDFNKNKKTKCYSVERKENSFVIETLEGNMTMTDKDVLIIGVQGEIYPCKIDIFKETYDVVE